jgi:hypothetical protein
MPGLLRNTLPAGGDIASHPYAVWYLAHQLLPAGHLSGWSMGWFGGFPLYTFYPPLPAVVSAVAGHVLPFAVAYKLGSAAGVLTLPVVAWAFARLCRLPSPYAALFACAAVAFLCDVSYTIAGGNIVATATGEYSYSWGLTLGLLTAGVFARSLETGRLRWLAAALLGLTAWSHPLPALWTVAFVVAIVLVAPRPTWRTRVTNAAAPLAVGLLLAGLWWLPYLVSHGWMTSPNFAKATDLSYLFRYHWFFELLLSLAALAGAVAAVRRGQRAVVALAVVTVGMAVAFAAAPQSLVWNVRLLPFWQFGRFFLAAAAIAEGARWLDQRVGVAGAGGRSTRAVLLAGPVALALVVFVVGLTWGALPGATVRADSNSNTTVRWAGLTIHGTFAGWLVKSTYAGLQARSDWPQLAGLIDTLHQVAHDQGCGRVAWDGWWATPGDRTPVHELFGGDLALTVLPMWTDGCLTTFRGILNDSSATSPYLQTLQSLTSTHPEHWVNGLTYPAFDLATGVPALRAAGARYYLTHGGVAETQAAASNGLTLVGSSGVFKVWEVRASGIVDALPAEPVVLNHSDNRTLWNATSVVYPLTAEADSVAIAASGPASWTRIDPQLPPVKPEPVAHVTQVHVGNSSVTFHVDRTGVPVIVRVSYFPGWGAHGALGPYRVAPNFMVVVPTSETVSLGVGRTRANWVALVFGLAGLAGVVALAWRYRRPNQPHPSIDLRTEGAGAAAPAARDGSGRRGPQPSAGAVKTRPSPPGKRPPGRRAK